MVLPDPVCWSVCSRRRRAYSQLSTEGRRGGGTRGLQMVSEDTMAHTKDRIRMITIDRIVRWELHWRVKVR